MGRRLAFMWFLAAAAVVWGCGGGLGAGSATIGDVDLLVEPSSVSFGTVAVGQEASREIKLSHKGVDRPIRLTAIRLVTDSEEGVFWFDEPDDTELGPGEYTVVVVHYRPAVAFRQDYANLYIEHDMPAKPTIRVPIDTIGGFAELQAIPNPIDFGEVQLGEEVPPMDVRLRNAGSQPLTIEEVYLEDHTVGFVLAGPVQKDDGEGLPAELGPGEEAGVVIEYHPAGGHCPDLTYLVVKLAGQEHPVRFEVTGCELAPSLVVSPGQVDFGYVKPGETVTKKLNLANEGQVDLNIVGVMPSAGSDPEIVIQDAPPVGTVLRPEESIEVTVAWTAKDQPGNGSEPIGGVQIESNDPTSPLVIPVFGVVDAPEIVLIPGDIVDFGFVAVSIPSKRVVAVRNDGHGLLEVSEVRIEGDTAGEFSFAGDAAFTVDSYGSRPIDLTFKNKGGKGEANARLVVVSNDPKKPTVEVPLKAARADKATCNPVLVPQTLNFGMVAMGYSKTLNFTIKNTGSGNCSFQSARVADCVGMPMPGFPGTCGDPFASGPSTIFKVVSVPPSVQNGLGPGAEATVGVRFTPPPSPSIWQGMFDTYNAKLAVRIMDTNVPPGEPSKEIIVPPATSMTPNVQGQGGMAKVAVLPGEVKFGLTTIGCASKTFKVCVYNTGNAPLEVSEIGMVGCSPEFKVKNVPPLPANVSAGKPLCFETVYVPQEEGEKTCMFQIKSSDTASPSLTVGLSGAGTYDTDQTDEFVQVSGQDVDVLFVIDDSGSMCEEQDRLVANFDEFIKSSEVWNNDYHIGVISVNVVNQAVMGKLNRGDAKLTPRFIEPNPNAGAQFAKLAKLGCDGNSDEQEAGLEASQLALSAPLTSDTGIKCSTDNDCKNNTSLCGAPDKCPYTCTPATKTCGGWNAGFLRDEAQLEVVVLSDEEDQSSAAPTFYIDFLKNIKGFYNANMMHFNSIVGEDQGNGGCTSPDGSTSAEAGKRYHMVSQETNGIIGSICDPNFATVMNQIGKVAFGLKVQFFLTRLADPPTVKVWVGGNACADGWNYDAPSNSVIFDDKGSCMPQPGQKIKVYYKTLCLTP